MPLFFAILNLQPQISPIPTHSTPATSTTTQNQPPKITSKNGSKSRKTALLAPRFELFFHPKNIFNSKNSPNPYEHWPKSVCKRTKPGPNKSALESTVGFIFRGVGVLEW